MGSEADDQYKVPLIAKLLHALPHYNITFHRTNSTFRPTDEIYLESLGILGSVPAALLIISLFGLLLYLMTRCCDRKPRPAHSITSLKVTLSVVTVLCCAAIGLGLYGNDDLHNGLLEVLTAGKKVDNLVSSVRNQTYIFENTLAGKIQPQLEELDDIFEKPTSNQTALSQLIVALNVVRGNVSIAVNIAGEIRRPLIGVSMSSFLSKGDQWELIRWPGTVAVLALLLVLCAVLLVGVARHSRCALILFSVCGLLAVTGSWLMSGLYLSSSVAVGDLCIDPADYLASEAPNDLPIDILFYYTQCESARSNPFTQKLRESQNAINNARSAMSIVSKISMVLFKSDDLQPKLGAVTADLNTSERLLTQLTALVDCKTVHYNYLNATRGLCEGGLLGLVLMLIASFIAAILLTVMVWVDSHTWIYIRKRNDYSQVEEPSYISHQPPQNHQTMSRTLPRNHNGPPVISGSHTLAHAGRKQHEMMAAHQHQHPHQHSHQNMRQMGTHTLGRLPSHNHSPSHMPGPNNACSDTHTHHPPYPPPHHPNSQHHHHQQQQQHYQQHQQQQQQHQKEHTHHPHPTHQQHHHHYSDGHQVQLTINAGAATMRRPPSSSNKDTVDATIPSSNAIDSAMYERDKQIYKCSTMRQGGRFDPKGNPMKPSILNCPLPEIPKKEEQVLNAEELTTSRYLPHNQQQRITKHPMAKAIPPPRILSPPPQPTQQQNFGGGISVVQDIVGGGLNGKNLNMSPPPPSIINSNSHPQPPPSSQQQQHQLPLPPPPQTAINPNDESNYAVTEL